MKYSQTVTVANSVLYTLICITFWVNTLNANFCAPVPFFLFLISSEMYVNEDIEVADDTFLKYKHPVQLCFDIFLLLSS